MQIHPTLKIAALFAAFLLLSAPGVFGGGEGVVGCVQLIGAAAEAARQERMNQQVLARAEQGDAEAQRYIGHKDLFVTVNEFKAEEAHKWLCRSAAQGHAPAQYDLGLFYSGDLDRQHYTTFIDFPHDDAYAYKWLTLASQSGFVLAQSRLEELNKSISPVDKRRGEQLLKNWRSRPCGPPIIR